MRPCALYAHYPHIRVVTNAGQRTWRRAAKAQPPSDATAYDVRSAWGGGLKATRVPAVHCAAGVSTRHPPARKGRGGPDHRAPPRTCLARLTTSSVPTTRQRALSIAVPGCAVTKTVRALQPRVKVVGTGTGGAAPASTVTFVVLSWAGSVELVVERQPARTARLKAATTASKRPTADRRLAVAPLMWGESAPSCRPCRASTRWPSMRKVA